MEKMHWDTSVYADDKARVQFKDLNSYRDLIFLFVRRTFVARYKQTILGPAWAIIQPFFTTVVYSVFFGNIAGLGASGVPNFIFYLSGTVIWTLFANCLVQTSETFLANYSILSKVYFPRLVMPISTVISQFIPFCIQFVFLLIFWVYYLIANVGLNPNALLLMIPLIILQVAILGMGCGLIVTSVTAKYRDLNMVVGFGVSLISYAAPVAYDMFGRSVLAPGGAYYNVYMLNPITPILNLFRYALLGIGAVDWLYYGISWLFSIVILFTGLKLFAKVERTFMDVL